MQKLTVSLLQCELLWESPEENRKAIEGTLRDASPETDLIVLPEMFSTGFSMNAAAIAEPPDGPTQRWLGELARELDCAITGSVAVRDGPAIVNRLLFVTPEGTHCYDKRHLFRMGGEHKHYAAGKERVVLRWRGWRIKPEICYDLRFPVFSRNRDDYDLLINVANWPARRESHWRALLTARAIENLACVVAVNRIGSDGNGIDYSGASLALDARGETLLDLESRCELATVTLDGDALMAYREAFPAWQDADDFSLSGGVAQ